jgi:hypothetical protein
MSWKVKKEVLFERTLPEARWSYSKIAHSIPMEPKRKWKVKAAA